MAAKLCTCGVIAAVLRSSVGVKGVTPRTRMLQFYTPGTRTSRSHTSAAQFPPGDKLLIHAKLLKGFGHAAQTLVTHEAAVLSHAIHLLHRAVPGARQICLDFILRTFGKFVFVGF